MLRPDNMYVETIGSKQFVVEEYHQPGYTRRVHFKVDYPEDL